MTADRHFVLCVDLKPDELERNPVISLAGDFATEQEAIDYVKKHPPRIIAEKSRMVGIAIVRGFMIESPPQELPHVPWYRKI